MTFIKTLGGIQNLSNGPDIGFQYQDNGDPWPSVLAAHNGTPEAYRAIGKVRYIDDGSGLKEYWYKDGIQFVNLVPRFENLETPQAFLDELNSIKDDTEAAGELVESRMNDLQTLLSQGFVIKGNWNVATNTPNLSSISKAGGDAYVVKGPGTTNITGESINAVDNDVFHWNATDSKWVYRPGAVKPGLNSVGMPQLASDVTSVLPREEEIAFINGKEILYAFEDKNGDFIEALFKDHTSTLDTTFALPIGNGLTLEKSGRSYTLKFGTAEGQMPFGVNGSVRYEEIAYVNGKEIIEAVEDANGDVVRATYKDLTTYGGPSLSLGVANGLTLQQTGGAYQLKFGTTEGQMPFGTDATVRSDGPVFVFGKEAVLVILDVNEDVVGGWYKDGSLIANGVQVDGLTAEVTAARGVKPDLNTRLSGMISSRALPTTPIWNEDVLLRWKDWIQSLDYRFDLLLIGDSYTQGSFFSRTLWNLLISDGHPNGGGGWCGFNRWGTISASINNSVSTNLVVSYNLDHWVPSSVNNMGIDGYITCISANTVLTLTSSESLASVTVLYEKHASAGDFRYRLNAGSWTVVSTANASQDVATLVIDTSAAGASFTIDIEALATGIILCGAIGRKAGNVLNVHKCGISGGQATLFGANALWDKSVGYLTPKMAMIMFGTNEMSNNVTPSAYKTSIANIITRLRTIDPLMDIVLSCPTYTTYETESPKTYKLQDYASVLFELSNQYRTAFVNHAIAFGPFSQGQIDAGFMNTDRVHPGVRGGKVIAKTYHQLLKK